MNLIFPPSLGVITESPNPTPQDEQTDSLESSFHSSINPGKRAESVKSMAAESFDVNGAYVRALNDEQVGGCYSSQVWVGIGGGADSGWWS